MARWKLAAGHYLNVAGNKWEYQEVSRTTGKTIRVQLPVPTHLDPRDPADFNHKWGHGGVDEGEIIVAQVSGAYEPADINFIGDPTPDMIPLDDEAKVISASFEERWRYKPESAEYSGNYSQSLIDQLQLSMAEVATKPTQVEGLSDLVTAISEMVKSNQELVKGFGRRI